MKSRILAIAVLVALISLGCAKPQEYEKFRRIGSGDASEDTFVLDREKCNWKAPPVPVASKWIYRDCMAQKG